MSLLATGMFKLAHGRTRFLLLRQPKSPVAMSLNQYTLDSGQRAAAATEQTDNLQESKIDDRCECVDRKLLQSILT